jgi:hypothetical protein
MAPDPKDERFQIRMSADERGMLRTLAEQAGESEATVVRRLVRRAFEAIVQVTRPRKTKR